MISGNATANFTYDGDGKQIKATVNGITAVYVGNHYEVKDSVVTKYYFAGATRIAVRTNGTLSYLLSDHIGSSSVTKDAKFVKPDMSPRNLDDRDPYLRNRSGCHGADETCQVSRATDANGVQTAQVMGREASRRGMVSYAILELSEGATHVKYC